MKEINQKWWHRMLKVILSLVAVPIFAVTALICIEKAGESVSEYSWKPGYKADGSQTECSPHIDHELRSAFIYCGSFSSTTELVDSMVQSGYITKPEAIPVPRNAYDDGRVLEAISKQRPITTYYHQVYNFERIVYMLGIAMAIFIATTLCLIGVYRLAIYIVHGSGVRIVKS